MVKRLPPEIWAHIYRYKRAYENKDRQYWAWRARKKRARDPFVRSLKPLLGTSMSRYRGRKYVYYGPGY